MHANFFPSAMRSDNTIVTAWTVLALFGAAQLFAVVFFYMGRAHVGKTLAPAAGASTRSGVAPNTVVTTSTRNASSPSINSLSQPPASITSPSAADRLVREAKALRDRGDTANALAKLQEATGQDPKNANVLAETGLIYESMQLFDRSNESWRRLQQIEPATGPLYELAEMKLKFGAPAAASSGPGLAGVSPLDAGTARADGDGIPDGSTFGITEATPAKTTDPDADTHVVLKVGVKARPNTPIDYTKVKIQVFFYDVVDNDRIVLTDADVSYEWLTADHNWSKTNPEILAVTYLRAKKDAVSSDAALSAAAAAVTPPAPGKRNRSRNEPPPPDSSADTVGQRKYLGYIVRVYYKDQLQAVRADPTKLLNLFPPPFTAPSPAP